MNTGNWHFRGGRVAASLLTLLASASCAVSPATSEYFRPTLDLYYKYGEFCGAGVPERVDGQDHLLLLQSSVPIDSVDFACQLHDICYELYMHDNPHCDLSVTNLLVRLRREFSAAEMHACENLTLEIELALGVKAKSSEQLQHTATLAVAAPAFPVTLGTHNRRVRRFGFPEEGECTAPLRAEELVRVAPSRFLPGGLEFDGVVTELCRAMLSEGLDAARSFVNLETCVAGGWAEREIELFGATE